MTDSIRNSSPVPSHWQPYPEYEDSGVEWLGEIPAHWERLRLKYAASVEMGQSPESADCNLNGIGRPFLQGNAEFGEWYPNPKQYCQTAKKLVQPGDFLISVRAPVGALNIADQSYGIGRGLCGIRIDPCYLVSEFTWFLLQVVRDELSISATGSTFDAVSADEVAGLRIFLPPLEEQHAIAAFLNRETARIDGLIAAKERLIAVLQEKRAALISHAVTKGLDPTVPMKDSGVEWLGEIPAHWEVKRLKFIGQVRSGVAKGRDLGGRSTIMIPYLRVANVQAGFLDLSDVAEIEVGVDEVERYLLQRGDVLMNEGGDFDKLGRGTVWQGQIALCIHQNHVFSVRPNYAGISEWIATVTLADYAKHYFILKSKQSTNLASISSSNLQDLPVVVPPLPEQQAILSFIRAETEKIDSLINKIAEGNVRLGEHRVALITAAVTGKIDVRG